jgi:hypothetical protein
MNPNSSEIQELMLLHHLHLIRPCQNYQQELKFVRIKTNTYVCEILFVPTKHGLLKLTRLSNTKIIILFGHQPVLQVPV